mmetsp:Transcript_22284/g.35934  ORF Transcript_22284/g.35934 Transcript_22284/m.35934 type:complete len:249 (-) Transcript_22284:127-873(-)
MGFTHLDLSRNNLGPNASKHIVSILRCCPVESLDISWCDLGDEGISSLCESLIGVKGSGRSEAGRGKINIKTIKLIGNRLSDVGALALIALAKEFKDLCRIEIEEIRLLRRPKIGASVYVRDENRSDLDWPSWEEGTVIIFDGSKGILVEIAEGTSKRRVWVQEVSMKYNCVSAPLMRQLVGALRANAALAKDNLKKQKGEEGGGGQRRSLDDDGDLKYEKRLSSRSGPVSRIEDKSVGEADSFRFIA